MLNTKNSIYNSLAPILNARKIIRQLRSYIIPGILEFRGGTLWFRGLSNATSGFEKFVDVLFTYIYA